MHFNFRFLLPVLCCLLANTARAQSRAGLTGIPDTSYSTFSAYQYTKQTNPGIRIAVETHPASVVKKTNRTYHKTGKRALNLDVFSPKNKSAAPRTAVIIIHGGG